MKRLLIPLVIVAGLLGPPVHASTTEASIVAELREQGFSQVEIRRTLLGRTRIIAKSATYEREIILNPASGVILRDFWRVRGPVGNDGPSSLVGRPNLRDGGDRSGSGQARSAADDDDDDSGSSGSSSGGSSDNDDDDDSGGSGSGGDDDDDDDDD